MLEDAADQLRRAATDSQKTAMFHLLVLKHADELANRDASEFCRVVGLPERFATEFRKVLALRRLMREKSIARTFL